MNSSLVDITPKWLFESHMTHLSWFYDKSQKWPKTIRKGIISQKRIVIQLCHNLSFPHFKSLFFSKKCQMVPRIHLAIILKELRLRTTNAYNLRLSIWYTWSLLKPDICFCIPVSGNSILFFWVTLMKGFSSSGTLLRLSNWSV